MAHFARLHAMPQIEEYKCAQSDIVLISVRSNEYNLFYDQSRWISPVNFQLSAMALDRALLQEDFPCVDAVFYT